MRTLIGLYLDIFCMYGQRMKSPISLVELGRVVQHEIVNVNIMSQRQFEKNFGAYKNNLLEVASVQVMQGAESESASAFQPEDEKGHS
ncbi:unnamed protein product [Dovyalis caffra]|uniref:Uncharacterized protein n=1 Tax=Dovyalis caffra TaxID=77055 RepID=A0AAV1SAL4_9ROSI|nr:unnamed protein product [Dovyalis caffra]